MRIVQIIDTLYVGGAEQLQVFFAKAAVSRGIQATVVSLTDSSHSHLPDQLRQIGATVLEFSGRNLFDPIRFIRLVRFLSRERFDAIHAHLSYASILGVLAGWITGTPVIVTLHNMHMDRWGKLAINLIRLGAQQVIMVGPSVAKAYHDALSGSHIHVIVNPVMPVALLAESECVALRKEILVDPTRPLILSTGRLNIQKGFGYLLIALDILRRTHPQVFLAIAVQGSLHDELSAQIISLNLQDHVRLLGVREDVTRLMMASDIYVSSSLWEGMPISILEAMAAGLPVVATDVGDVPYVVTDKTGMLVPPAVPELLSARLALLLDKPLLRQQLGRAGREYVSMNHNLDTWFTSLMMLYQDTISSHGRKDK